MQEKASKNLKQPKILSLALTTAMSERFSYYLIGFLLLLYVKAVYKFSDEKGFMLFALFTALAHLTPAIGGYLADNFIGIKRCLGLGLLIEAVGFFLLAIPTSNMLYFYLALGFIVIGSGMFKTAPTNLLGRSYAKDDPKIDTGFTLYYMGINIGSFSSSLVAGMLTNSYGYHIPFLIGGIGLIVGFIWFMLFKHYGKEYESKAGNRHFNTFKLFIVVVSVVFSAGICAFFMFDTTLANLFFYAGCAAVLFFLLYQTIISSKEDRIKIMACMALIGLSTCFHILYYQLFESIIFYVERCVDKNFLGLINIPTATYPGINAIIIIALSPILASIYNKLEKNNKSVAVTTKFPLGLFIMSLSFFLLAASTYFSSISSGQVAGVWVIMSIFLYSLSELLIAALGLAMITRIAPERLYGIMMGVWFLIGSAMAANLSGYVARWAAVPESLQANLEACLHIYGNAFLKMGFFGLLVAIIGFAIAPFLKKAAGI